MIAEDQSPWEIWLSEDGEQARPANWFWHGDPDQGGKGWVVEKNAVRYLRADLVCNDCEHLVAAYPELGMLCMWRLQPGSRNNPACFVFKPKVGK